MLEMLSSLPSSCLESTIPTLGAIASNTSVQNSEQEPKTDHGLCRYLFFLLVSYVLIHRSVAEYGFGSGSLQEDAVRALQGAGVEAVI